MRLLIYSQDGMGLGHHRRTRNIAQEVLRREPDCNILVVTDSPATPFFPPLTRLDYLKLPTIVKTSERNWRPGSLCLGIDDTVNLRARLILEAFLAFVPDAILVDHMPVGALGELKPLLEAVTRAASRPKLFLGLRDILDSPEATSRVWTDLDAYAYLRHYDSVLIYGCRDIYDAESAYQLTRSARKVTYCNYVSSDSGGSRAYDAPDESVLLAMGGGGHDFFPIARAFLEALPILLGRMQLRSVILTGPNMARSEREALMAQSAGYPVQIPRDSEDATPWLQRSSAVLTMAGYNSLCEVLAWRKKAVVIPRAGPSAEQRMRTELFARRRLVRTLDPVSLTPDALADALMQLMMEDRIPETARIPPLDGAQRAATLLLARDAMAVCPAGGGNYTEEV